MEYDNGVKALFIIVNAGYAGDIVELARGEGATGATILNARGDSVSHEVFMGITVDSEKEIVLCLVQKEISERITAAVKKKAGYASPAHSICFVMPVESIVGLGGSGTQGENEID
jgi:nitrogen regulatory protein PII